MQKYQQSVAYQLKWPKLLSKQHAVPSMIIIFIFVLMTTQKKMEMHHNHKPKDENINIQKWNIPSTKMFCHNWEQLLIIILASISGGYDASLVMFNKKTNLKITLHYDSTTRNSIDGEWPGLISSFSDGLTFRHRPIVFAFEDRKQIASLIVETYKTPCCSCYHNQWKDYYSC